MILIWTLRLVVWSSPVWCFFGAWWSSSDARRAPVLELDHEAPVLQGRGELWLRCPGSDTWYSYAGDPREWRTVTTGGELTADR